MNNTYKYTVCFIRQNDNILMLNRQKPVWMGSWNGVGGSIETDETPTQCILREIHEETGIKIANAQFKGIVSWTLDGVPSGGMYAFIADLKTKFEYPTPQAIPEGILDWKKISWIIDPQNTGVADNIRYFLPIMLNDDRIFEHECIFENDHLIRVDSEPSELTLSEDFQNDRI